MSTNNKSPVGYTVEGIVAMAGGAGEVAKMCNVPIQSVKIWRYIPPWHARTVAIAAGLPLAVVRPDMVQDAAAELAALEKAKQIAA